ncbi:hypothetical protein QJQ45_019712 [Haematococcus lacustris]|nr:hypothetical protein QJQ45_019712 [Haematococcus lacustris]
MGSKTVPNKYGMLMDHTYLDPRPKPGSAELRKGSTGEPTDRDHGLNMKATIGRSGKVRLQLHHQLTWHEQGHRHPLDALTVLSGVLQLNDGTFTKFIPLLDGDPYEDPLKTKLKADAEKKKKNLTEVPFKTASPMKQSACPGDFYGTNEKVPYIAGHMEVQKKKGDVPQQPKGIYTSPAKKGGFGMNKTTLSEHTGTKGVATEYEYQHDPETWQEQKRREAAEADRKARVTELPFKPSNPAKKGGFGVPNTTISKGKGVVGEWEYLPGTATPLEGTAVEKKEVVAFKPSYAFASQRVEKIPYIHDPEVPKLQAMAAKVKEEQARLAVTGPWKPNFSTKTDMVRSIVKMNIR